ncbi:alpha/beta-Hydrolases superfamily protein [Rhynchospora pubera]|uniref:Alpha/beta-Hydrolases superfamily protein n=1 Tax=Rhynchospora pubera TaxID=906938 RepID=A0AAV8HNZ5_9POAL|nr:alpha/beta-Hydrolases superfamily protein [Rhynchospora pubera]
MTVATRRGSLHFSNSSLKEEKPPRKNYAHKKMVDSKTKNKPLPSSSSSSGMFKRLAAVPLLVLLTGLIFEPIKPQPPKICGTANGPPVTSNRTKLNDGRHVAYVEFGVPREKAKNKIIFIHGFDACRYDTLKVSQELLEELSIYLVGFDRPGYGESDPDPKKTVKSIATDIEEMADNLQLGPKFYVIGFSMGGEAVWSVLKYIPHRLAGAALLGPVANYWWSGFPANVTEEAWNVQLPADKWVVWVAHHFPWLTNWWNSQKYFPSSSVITQDVRVFCPNDLQVLHKWGGPARAAYVGQIVQQGNHESLHRDMIVGFGSWDFSPLDLENPFPNNEGSVHLWHGTEDLIVPVHMSRYIAQQHPWITYHELPTAGHMFILGEGMGDTIVRSLLGQD